MEGTHAFDSVSWTTPPLLPIMERAPTQVAPHACAAFSSHDLCHFSNDALVSANLSAALFVKFRNASLSTIPGALLTYWLSVQSHLGFLSAALVQHLCSSMAPSWASHLGAWFPFPVV